MKLKFSFGICFFEILKERLVFRIGELLFIGSISGCIQLSLLRPDDIVNILKHLMLLICELFASVYETLKSLLDFTFKILV